MRVDLDRHQVRRAGKDIAMTAREFALLAYFLRNPERALTRDTLLGEVWQTDYLSQRTIDNFVGRLRAKFEPDPDRPRYFLTVRGVGYRFEPGGARAAGMIVAGGRQYRLAVPRRMRRRTMDLGLKGAAAVVTGGSKGMGRATALCLAGDGARVCVLARGQRRSTRPSRRCAPRAAPMRSALSVDLGNAERDRGGVPHASASAGASSTASSTRSARTPATSSS